MLTAKDIGGAMGMMPAFATDDAVDIRATQTVAVDNLAAGVDRIIKDGIDVISTTGTYGECYNLLWEEFQTSPPRPWTRSRNGCPCSSA